jgi:hypothetical protein
MTLANARLDEAQPHAGPRRPGEQSAAGEFRPVVHDDRRRQAVSARELLEQAHVAIDNNGDVTKSGFEWFVWLQDLGWSTGSRRAPCGCCRKPCLLRARP